jgi:hypothetical protein
MTINTFKITSAVKIQTKLDRPNPDVVTIEIEDPSDIVKVNYVPMTQVSPDVYEYVFQSIATDDDGNYQVTIKATYGAYTATEQSYFTMLDIDP